VKVESVEFFYASMPVITDNVDGSQDALLVRVGDGIDVGWGECEASPLTCVAAFATPMSHGACQGVAPAVLGHRIDTPDDVRAFTERLRLRSLDLLQAPHVASGIETALWDLLGRRRGVPVWRLLGHGTNHRRVPYASVLFGDDAEETLRRATDIAADGYRAAKFGWGPYGHGSADADAELVRAAREGLGPEAALMIDAGQVWGRDVAALGERWPALVDADVLWIEEPFAGHALGSFGEARRELVGPAGPRLAAGEASHAPEMALNLIDLGGVEFIQIDAGRIGGVGPAAEVAAYADERGVTYVNHTFTSHLALSASLQPYAGFAGHPWCEYPTSLSPLALALTRDRIERDADGLVAAPDSPGLGIEVDLAAITPYLRSVDIDVDGVRLISLPGKDDTDARRQ